MKISIIIPAHNEEGSIQKTVDQIHRTLDSAKIDYEIIIVNDHSIDRTGELLSEMAAGDTRMKAVENRMPPGFGYAVRSGLEAYRGDAAVIVMGDHSDVPEDILAYHRKFQEGYECVFGSRFMRGSKVINYPSHKLIINRIANWFIRLLFGVSLNDTTNAFKGYKRNVIDGIQPLISPHFNLTVEMPLKAIIRGYSFAVIPIQWHGRISGISKLKIKEMGGRYLFIVLYLWLEKMLSRGDYFRRDGDKASTT